MRKLFVLRAIKKVCVCGAGTMGSGIVQVIAQAGFEVVQYDVQETMLVKSKANIERGFEILTTKGKLTPQQKEDYLDNILFTSNIHDCRADLIVEAIIENKQAKIDLFNNLMNINSEETVFATNTSSISVSEIASSTKYPHDVVGIHFFNPAPIMKLVEIVRAASTANNVTEQVFAFAKQLGKTPVVCKDSPGFIVNRVARPYYLEAIKLAESNVAEPGAIDRLMEATGFKMGPFKLMDLIGIDINYAVSNIVWEALGKPERLKPSMLQKQKIDEGHLGKKTGSGFYDYPDRSQ